MVIRLSENVSISKRHSGSDNLEEAKDIATWQNVFSITAFSCNITRHGATRMAWAGCDDIKDL